MSLLSLVFKKTQRTVIESTAIDGSVVAFEIDATVSMVHERSASPTKSPIESGNLITDHVVLENNRLVIEGVVTDNPFTIIQTVNSILDPRALQNPLNFIEQGKSIFRQVGTIARLLTNNESRVENAFRYLEEIHKNRIPFSIVTGLKKYENMILTNLSIPQTVDVGDSIRFNATFEQINIVESQLSVNGISKTVSKTVRHTANNKKQSGKKQTKQATEKIERKSSVLFKVLRTTRQ